MAHLQRAYEFRFIFMPVKNGLGNAQRAIHMDEISKFVHFFNRRCYIIIFWNLKKLRHASLDKGQNFQKTQEKKILFPKFSE